MTTDPGCNRMTIAPGIPTMPGGIRGARDKDFRRLRKELSPKQNGVNVNGVFVHQPGGV